MIKVYLRPEALTLKSSSTIYTTPRPTFIATIQGAQPIVTRFGAGPSDVVTKAASGPRGLTLACGRT